MLGASEKNTRHAKSRKFSEVDVPVCAVRWDFWGLEGLDFILFLEILHLAPAIPWKKGITETTSLGVEQRRLEEKVQTLQLNEFQQPHRISFKGQLAEEKEPN